jgi:hypothetical protein
MSRSGEPQQEMNWPRDLNSGWPRFALLNAEFDLVQSSRKNLPRLRYLFPTANRATSLHGARDRGAFGSGRSDSTSHDDCAIRQRTTRPVTAAREWELGPVVGRKCAARRNNRAAEFKRTSDICARGKKRRLLCFEAKTRWLGVGQLSERSGAEGQRRTTAWGG